MRLGKYTPWKVILGFIILSILFPFIYLAYDRFIVMPPPPNWVSPPFTPDTIKAPWIRNPEGGAGYFLDFVAKHKDNNAFAHYLNAFSMFTISSRDEEALYSQLSTIADKDWTELYPLVEETLILNQKVLDEIHLGAQIQHSEMPPTAYMTCAPILNFRFIRNIAYLQVAKGRKLEKQNHFE